MLLLNSETKAKKRTVQFLCTIYKVRPSGCRNYPFIDAQITFEDCVFIRSDVELTTLSDDAIASYCIECGKCCFAWTLVDDIKVPVARCDRLEIRPCRQRSKIEPDVESLLSLTKTISFA